MNIAPFPVRAAHAATVVWRRAVANGVPDDTARRLARVVRLAVTAGKSPASVTALNGRRARAVPGGEPA